MLFSLRGSTSMYVVAIRRSIIEPHSFAANELPLPPASLLRVIVTGVTLSSALYEVSSFREATIATAEYFWLSTARWSCRQHATLLLVHINPRRKMIVHTWRVKMRVTIYIVFARLRRIWMFLEQEIRAYNLRWLTEVWQCAISYKKNFIFKWKKESCSYLLKYYIIKWKRFFSIFHSRFNSTLMY